MTNMMNLLPTLALLAMGLTGLERVPTTALAHIQRSPNDLHRHLATRQRLAGQVGAQEKRSGNLRKNKRGQTCRPRSSASPSPAANEAAAASAAPSSEASTAEASPTASPTPAASSAEPAASSGQPGNNLVAIGASVAVSVGQPSPSQGSGSVGIDVSVNVGNAGITGGWTNQGSKFGSAWPNGNWAQTSDPNYIGNYIGSKTAWYYTWSPSNVGSADSLGLEFVPMLWGPSQESAWWSSQGSWPSTVKNALFFNEPNEQSQSNIAAADSVQYWMNDMVPVRHNKNVALGSAATTNAPSGLTWVQDLISLCQQDGNSKADCTPDFVPIHWYSTDPNEFQQYVSNFNAQTGLDIWITEYACQSFTDAPQCDSGQTWQLHQGMAAWFDSQDYVKRYSPFGMMENMQGVNQDNALMNPDGSITSLGSWYISSA